MSVQARWVGHCPDCDQPWNPGDWIRNTDTRPGVWRHATCPTPPDNHVQPGEVSCTTCFLIHPIGECDR